MTLNRQKFWTDKDLAMRLLRHAMTSFSRGARRALYRAVRGAFHKQLLQEFMHEMLASETQELKWTLVAEYTSGVRDTVVMSVKVESMSTSQSKTP